MRFRVMCPACEDDELGMVVFGLSDRTDRARDKARCMGCGYIGPADEFVSEEEE